MTMGIVVRRLFSRAGCFASARHDNVDLQPDQFGRQAWKPVIGPAPSVPRS